MCIFRILSYLGLGSRDDDKYGVRQLRMEEKSSGPRGRKGVLKTQKAIARNNGREIGRWIDGWIKAGEETGT